jgi:DNA-binding beta-propeller fold protein YncE
MGVAVSGRFLYVANTDMNRIDVFDKPSRAFLRHVPNRTGVRGLSVDEHGRLYAAVQDDCCVQVFAA